jgi:UDPglucose--hexose-1-phosphate uridylyltransferase
VYKRELKKPDGRDLILYARAPIDPAITAPAAGLARSRHAHLRWHPLRGEWVVYADHRQDRTFLPPAAANPLAPTTDPAHPTEVPAGGWEVAVFENLFSALGSTTLVAPKDIVDTAVAQGRCEVVVFTQDPSASLGGLPVEHVELVLQVWADRTSALAARGDIHYVFPFENRGVEVGVTLTHPHGQIYGYPFIPPIAARELELQHGYFARHQKSLLGELIVAEIAADKRTIYLGQHAIAFVPVCARWAYELWIAPYRTVPTLAALSDLECHDLATALRLGLRKLDALWQRPMPYVLAVHQAPVHGNHPYAHVHIEIYPWLRMPGRLKYLAGSEIGAGTFTADTLPETKAAELRALEVQ